MIHLCHNCSDLYKLIGDEDNHLIENLSFIIIILYTKYMQIVVWKLITIMLRFSILLNIVSTHLEPGESTGDFEQAYQPGMWLLK